MPESITIPLRGGDLVLTPNGVVHGNLLSLSAGAADIHIALPRELFSRLAEIGDVVTIWRDESRRPAMAECDCGTGGLLAEGGHEHWCATFGDQATTRVDSRATKSTHDLAEIKELARELEKATKGRFATPEGSHVRALCARLNDLLATPASRGEEF